MRSRRRAGLPVVVLVAITLLGGCSPSDDSDTVSEFEREIAALPAVADVTMNYLIDGFPAAAHWRPEITLRDEASLDEIEDAGTKIVELFRSHDELSDLDLSVNLTFRERGGFLSGGIVDELDPEAGGRAWRLFARLDEQRYGPYAPELYVSLSSCCYPDYFDFKMFVRITLPPPSTFADVPPVYATLLQDFPEDPQQVTWQVGAGDDLRYTSNFGLPSQADLDAGLEPNNGAQPSPSPTR